GAVPVAPPGGPRPASAGTGRLPTTAAMTARPGTAGSSWSSAAELPRDRPRRTPHATGATSAGPAALLQGEVARRPLHRIVGVAVLEQRRAAAVAVQPQAEQVVVAVGEGEFEALQGVDAGVGRQARAAAVGPCQPAATGHLAVGDPGVLHADPVAAVLPG